MRDVLLDSDDDLPIVILFLGYFLKYGEVITVSPDNENFIQFFRNQFAKNSNIIPVDVCNVSVYGLLRVLST
jgi:hypothetical protein